MIKTSQMRSREEVLVLSSCRSFLEVYDDFGVDTHVDGKHPRRDTPHHGSAIHAFTRSCCIELLERQLLSEIGGHLELHPPKYSL